MPHLSMFTVSSCSSYNMCSNHDEPFTSSFIILDNKASGQGPRSLSAICIVNAAIKLKVKVIFPYV